MSVFNLLPLPSNCENSSIEPYNCKNCDFTTNLNIFLKTHIKDCHTSKSSQEGTTPQYSVQNCKNCHFETSSSLQWLKHAIGDCCGTTSDKNLSHKSYWCQFCDFETNVVMFLSKHIQDCHVVLELGNKKASKIGQLVKSYFICRNCSFETRVFLEWRDHVMLGCVRIEPRKISEIFDAPKKFNNFFNCKHCLYTTTDIRYFKQHMIRHTPDSEIEWCQCDLCPYKAKNKGSLTVHRYNHFKKTPTSREDKFFYSCDHCSFNSKYRANMRRHLMDVHKEQAQAHCFQCPHCPHTALFKEDLERHQSRHKTKPIFECEQCSHVSKSKWRLNAHIIAKHRPEDSDINCYRCEQCDFRSVLKTALKKHIINKHLSEEDIQWHQCDFCPFKSKLKHNLKKHVWIRHSESNLIKCDQCQYTAKLKVLLDRHKITAHLTEQEIQWFQCDKCPYKGKMRQDLRAHELRLHKQRKETKCFDCDICKCKTKSKFQLNEHKKTHLKG